MNIAARIRIDHAVLRPEEQIPAHGHDPWELVYVITGRGRRTIGDTTEPFAEGEVILIPPGMSHQWIFSPDHTDAEGHISDIALFFASELLDEIAMLLPEFGPRIEVIATRTEAVRFEGRRKKMMQKLMVRLAKANTDEMKTICFLSLLILLGAAADHEAVVGHKAERSASGRKVEKVRIYCECNFMKRINLAEASLHAGMNVSSFCKFFLQNFGCPFTEYINRLRVAESCRRLSTSADPVCEIAYGAGFASVPYFNRVFLRQCGCTPTQYRTGKMSNFAPGMTPKLLTTAPDPDHTSRKNP